MAHFSDCDFWCSEYLSVLTFECFKFIHNHLVCFDPYSVVYDVANYCLGGITDMPARFQTPLQHFLRTAMVIALVGRK